jgi:hypothetical protein
MPKNAIIVGMPRSGTSLAAAIFARKGYYVGRSNLPHVTEGDDHNPFGYFEADDVIAKNVELFQQVGYACHNTWLFDRIPDESVDQIAQSAPHESHRRFVEHYAANTPWVWKDCRLCLTLPYWWKMMDPARTGVVLVRRDPLDIYHSFRRKGWCPSGSDEELDRVRERTRQHIEAATSAIDVLSIPHVEVDYSEYRQCPDRVARRLGEFFEVDLAPADLNFRPELDHNTRRGRAAAWLRIQVTKLPRRPIRTLERMIPRRLLALIFAERKYTDGGAAWKQGR